MRVDLYTTSLSMADSGLAAATLHLAEALGKYRDLQQVCVHGFFGPEKEDRMSLDNVDISSYVPKLSGKLPISLDYWRSIRRTTSDLVDLCGLWQLPSIATAVPRRGNSPPHIVSPHGMLDPWALKRSPAIKKVFRKLFEDSNLHSARCIRTTSTLEADHVRNLGYRNPIFVVPNGVNVPDIDRRRAEDSGPKNLLFMSRLHPKKGLDLLLKVWKKLYRRHTDWQLIIAGPDEIGYLAYLENIVEEYSLERVIFRGPVSLGERTEVYDSADLFVLPSYAENFGLVVAESLAHELPVITTHHTPWSGLNDRNCGMCIELSEDRLHDALNTAMSLSVDDLRRMGSIGRDWMAEDFTWETVARQMSEIYAWAIGGGEAPQHMAY